MTKEAKAIIELIENNKEKARDINTIENTMELAYLRALTIVNGYNYSEEVANYIIKLYDLRLKEIDIYLSKTTAELEEISDDKL